MPSKKSSIKKVKKTKQTSKGKKVTTVSKSPTRIKRSKKPVTTATPQPVKTRLNFGLSFWLIILFFCLQFISALLWYTAYEKTVLSFNLSPTVSANFVVSGAPTHINIPNAAIDLGIIPANIEQGIWQIPDTNAAHLASSAQPGAGGNVILYAHNKSTLFGNLHTVNEGDTITIVTTAKTKHEYVVREKMVVKPQDISVAMPTDFEVLTVYTCTGFLDSERLVLKAYPVRVSSL